MPAGTASCRCILAADGTAAQHPGCSVLIERLGGGERGGFNDETF